MRTGEGGPRVAAPKDYVPLADHETERLQGAMLRQNPYGKATLVGRKSPRGFKHGMVATMVIDSDDLPSIYGETVRTVAEAAIANGEVMTRGLPESAAPRFTTTANPEGRYVDVDMVLSTPTGEPLQSYMRFWVDNGARYHEAGCQCAGPGCVYGRRGCELPAPGPSALSIDTVIDGGQSPTPLQTESGSVRTQMPPYFSVVASEKLPQLVAGDLAAYPLLTAERLVSAHGPRDDSGIVMLSDAMWCVGKPLPCLVPQVRAMIEDAARREAARAGETAEVEVRVTEVDGRRITELEIRQDRTAWSRHQLWAQGGGVRELACICGGQACVTVEHTCVLQPQ